MPVDLNTPLDYSVELPAGGRLQLQTPDEVEMWNDALAKYREDYVIAKHNDLVTLGSLLLQQLVVYRCQYAVNGMEPEVDKRNVPTGSYKRADMDGQLLGAYQKALIAAQQEMGRLEKQLGIDKATRESGGAHTLENYIKTLKRAAHTRGIHISKRTLAYEAFVNELRWKVRMLAHADTEDRAYHDISGKTVFKWIYDELKRLEKIDKDFARDKGKVFIGQL